MAVVDQPERVLIAGASGGIAAALGSEISQRFPDAELLTVSRRGEAPEGFTAAYHLQADLTDAGSVTQVAEFIAEKGAPPDWVICCCGILHTDDHGPEKALDQCEDAWLLESMRINVITHMHLARALSPALKPSHPLVWASLSAKVGSIGDNNLGGWYSYRMSKAALNMFVRNLSIEWGRRLDHCCVVAVHPGTTDTELSKPFQKNIREDKLYSAATSAERIVDVLAGLDEKRNGKLLFWDGEVLPW
ncbi:cell-cell signaling protein [Microbulbifer flavimaris]|uniref:Cell-cell signaling protein n=1 Tax=Microbulbifer flavimaris TaxID=1781068 RepID=A0ABX4I1X1_9GAMM|nr:MULTISPECIES: SDR family NAD(P)-dependent oxidoreductase [Microbulbifer]KUJ83992.1 cell-cell signaling protein [Microbulbifer sp. ZGT114]PCO06163.1 cell-cell signaling protein [Microbulbifer flavimaris]